MIGARTRIFATLRVLSPLHIGTGHRGPIESGEGQGLEMEGPSATLVMLDHRRLPYIPGSSLKGVLRRLSRDPTLLFGPESGSEEHASGNVIFWSATACDTPTHTGPVPYDNSRADSGSGGRETQGLFIDSRTAIDPETGVAERSRLFHSEQVLPGTEFAFSLTLAAQAGREAENELAEILAALCAPEGVGLGRNSRQGNGRVQLICETIREEVFSLGGKVSDAPPVWRKRVMQKIDTMFDATRQFAVILRGQGPFLIADNSPHTGAENGEAPQVTGLADFHDHGPRLTGATLLGALRSRFAWERALKNDAKTDDKDRVFTCAQELTATERLFGVTGWKGRVSLGLIRLLNEPPKQTIMSVKLDRFSGAPMDNALFGTEAWINPEFRVVVTLAQRAATDEETTQLMAEDDELFADFLTTRLPDPVWGGLALGLGQNKGYGVFKVEIADG